MKFAFLFTLIFEVIWSSIPLVPAIFLTDLLRGALQLLLAITWTALTIPVGVAAVSRLMRPLTDQDLKAFMSFRRREGTRTGGRRI
jgi:hypothetical protein